LVAKPNSLLTGPAVQGNSFHQGQLTPFHGYFFRLLTKQGAAAKGGAIDYVVNGKLTRGFAFAAYPAEYRNSGRDDLYREQEWSRISEGPRHQTTAIASAMQEYNPESTWERVD
jgi:Protein of unknown function (DUF2950)